MDSYYFDREEALHEMYNDAWYNYEEDQEEQEEEDTSLTAQERNESLS